MQLVKKHKFWNLGPTTIWHNMYSEKCFFLQNLSTLLDMYSLLLAWAYLHGSAAWPNAYHQVLYYITRGPLISLLAAQAVGMISLYLLLLI